MAFNLSRSPKRTDRAVAAAGFASYVQLLTRARGRYEPVFAVKLRNARVPSNHPFVPEYARALNLTTKRFVTIFSAHAKPMSSKARQAAATMGNFPRRSRHPSPSPPQSREAALPPMEHSMEALHDAADERASATTGNGNGHSVAPMTIKALKARRVELGLSQQRLSLLAGFSGSMVSALEAGRNAHPDTLARIADALAHYDPSAPILKRTRGGKDVTLGRRGGPRHRALDPSRADHALMIAAGIKSPGHLAAKALGAQSASGSFLGKIRHRTVPPNHPYIPYLATALGVREGDVVAAFSGGTAPMSDVSVRRLTSAGIGPRKGRAGRYQPQRPGRALVVGRPVVRGYNTLKKRDLTVRQATRAIVSTLNVAAMAGERAITIPVDALYAVLVDYVERCHIKGAVLVAPDFAEQFG